MALEIGPASLEELQEALALAAQEGWNPGTHDARAFFAVDPEGFLAGRLGGRTVGFVSAVRYGPGSAGECAFGFVGLFLVRQEHRGRGYGRTLFDAAMARLALCACIGLDGVVEQQAFYMYRRRGFKYCHPSWRYEGAGPASSPISPPTVDSARPDALLPSADDERIVPLSECEWGEVERYDRRHFPAPRPAFLRAFTLEQRGTISLALITPGPDGSAAGAELRGYGVMRQCGRGRKVGPLFADSPDHASRLLAALRSYLTPGEPFFLDAPGSCSGGLDSPGARLAEGLGMRRVFETARMYAGPAPAFETEGVFGLTTFELG